MDDTEGVGLRKLMQLQFRPDGEKISEILCLALPHRHADKNVIAQKTLIKVEITGLLDVTVLF